jgi:hypothetical protein
VRKSFVEVKASIGRKKREGKEERRSLSYGGPSAVAMVPAEEEGPMGHYLGSNDGDNEHRSLGKAKRSGGRCESKNGAAVRVLDADDGVAERCCWCYHGERWSRRGGAKWREE